MKSSGFRLTSYSSLKRLVNLYLRFFSLSIRGTYIGRGSSLSAKLMEIGFGTRINGSIVIKGAGSLNIGRYCAIGDNVRIITSNHKMNVVSVQLKLQKKILDGTCHIDHEKIDVIIGNDVWIGDNAVLLPGVKVDDGAVIGSGTIVTKSVESYTVVAGNPARPIGKRFPEEIAHLLRSLKWWDWKEEQVNAAAFLFKHEFGSHIENDKEVINAARKIGD